MSKLTRGTGATVLVFLGVATFAITRKLETIRMATIPGYSQSGTHTANEVLAVAWLCVCLFAAVRQWKDSGNSRYAVGN